MHLFFSVGEPSGDQHTAHLIGELRRRVPQLRAAGFGGPLMERAGCSLLCRMTEMAVMGLLPVIPLLRKFFRLRDDAERYFREHRPDAVVLVDFPGFNWHIARAAKKAGIPVFYYLPPQIWAWASWRVNKMRRYVDHVLSALPFEPKWYAEHGLTAEYVGHPIADEVAEYQYDESFIANRLPALPIVAVLPGSRTGEVRRNWPLMLDVMRRVGSTVPQAHFVVACYREAFRDWCRAQLTAADARLSLQFEVGKTPEILKAAHCSLAVSGSISLELVMTRTPTVILYRPGLVTDIVVRLAIQCRYMSLPNLIADREIMPEFYCSGRRDDNVAEMAATLTRWLTNPVNYTAACVELDEIRDNHLKRGATQRAATAILSRLPARPALRVA
jgi:lipid-A-disaccharide synthase